jgi:hypothetical protein
MSEPRLPPTRSSYPGHSGYARVDKDYYREPAWITDALLNAVQFTGTILDPCCGGGRIPSRCLERGLHAVGSDIVDRGFGEVQDVFDRTEPVANVITNPPYTFAQPIVEHLYTVVAERIALLLRLAFWEGKCRTKFFAKHPPALILGSIDRVSCPPGRVDRDGPRDRWGAIIEPEERGGKMPYAWFIWQIGHTGDTVIRRI